MRYKAIIFDLDGTLLNTIEDLANCMNAVLQRSGHPVHETEAYKLFIGNGLRNLVTRALPAEKCDEAAIDLCLAGMKEEYGRRWAEKTRPYEGIPELLDGLKEKNIKMAVLSNKADEFTKAIVAKLLPHWRFEAVLGERTSVPRKPDPAAALEIAGMMGIRPRDILYLGDSGTDMETASAAGMYAVGALWGFRGRDELLSKGAKKLIDKPSELLELIASI